MVGEFRGGGDWEVEQEAYMQVEQVKWFFLNVGIFFDDMQIPCQS